MARKLKQWLSVLMAVMMLMSIVPTSAFADIESQSNSLQPGGKLLRTVSQTAKDLTSHIYNFTNTSSGNEFTSGSAEVVMYYDLKNTDLRSGNDVITQWYLNSDDFGLKEWIAANGGDVFADDGSIIGSYTVSEDKKTLTITFDEDFTQQAAKDTGSGIEGKIQLWASWKIQEGSNPDVIIQRINGKTVYVYPHGKADLSISKNNSGINLKDGTVKWTIQLVSEHGTGDEVTVIDTLDARMQYTGITASNTSGETPEPLGATIKYYKNESDMTAGTPETSKEEATIAKIVLPKMDGTTGTTTKYTISVTSKIRDASQITEATDFKNWAKASTKDFSSPAEDNLVKGPVESKAHYATPSIEKKYGYYNTNTKKFHWVITINKEKVDVSGKNFSDELNGELLANLSSIVSDFKIKVNNGRWITSGTVSGATVDWTNKTIEFTTVNNNPNLNTYTIEYETVPQNYTDSGVQATNTAHLDKLSDSQTLTYEKSEAGDWIKKSGSQNDAGRVTWTITINPNQFNIAGATLDSDNMFWVTTQDNQEIKTPVGPGEYGFVSGSAKINNVAVEATSIKALLAAVNKKIKEDTTEDGKNLNQYTIVYSVQITNFRNGGLLKNEATYKKGATVLTAPATVTMPEYEDGVGTGSGDLTKTGTIENGQIKWSIVINPDYGIIDPTMVFSDALSRTAENVKFADTKLISWSIVSKLYGVQDNSATGTATSDVEKNDFAQMVAAVQKQINTDNKKGDNYRRYEITVYSTIENKGHIFNVASFGKEGNLKEDSAQVEVKFTMAIDKAPTRGERLENENLNGTVGANDPKPEGVYKHNWQLKVKINADYDLPSQTLTLVDTLGQGQVFRTSELTAEKFEKIGQNPVVTPTGLSADKKTCTGFSVSFTGINKNADGWVVNLSSYVALGEHSGLFTNTAYLSSDGEQTNDVTASVRADEDIAITKRYSGTPDKDGYALSDHLEWTLEFKVIDGINGKDIVVNDKLPANIQLLGVTVKNAENTPLVKLANTNGQISGSMGILGGNTVTATCGGAGQNLEIKFANQTLIAGSTVEIIVAAKALDSIFNGAEGISVNVTNKAELLIEGARAEASVPVDIRNQNSTPVVTKNGHDIASRPGTVEYTVEINDKNAPQILNPDAEDPTKSAGPLTLTDTLTVNLYGLNSNASINLESWKITAGTGENERELGSDEYSVAKVENKNGSICTVTLTFSGLPDGEYLKILYTYKVINGGDIQNKELVFTNVATLSGVRYIGGGDDVTKPTYSYDSKVTGSTCSLSFLKYRKGNLNEKIGGATFTLEKWNGTSWDLEQTAISNTDGEIPFVYTFSKGQVYRIKEKKAANGYVDSGYELVFQIGGTSSTVDGETVVIVPNMSQVRVPNIKKTDIEVEKRWEDEGNQDGKRPTEIQVQLFKQVGDGEKQKVGNPVTLNKGNGWKHTFTNLPEYALLTDDDSQKITYTVEEVGSVLGYNAPNYTTEAGKVTIVNSYVPEKTKVSGTKTWNDAHNQDGVRPASVTVQLQRLERYEENGEQKEKWVNVAGKTATITASNLSYTFDELDMYENLGDPDAANTQLVVYRVIEKDLDDAYTAAGGTKDTGYNLTNEHIPEKTSVSGTKTWNDDGDRDGVQPASVTVQLQRLVRYEENGEQKEKWVDVAGKTATITASNLSYTFDGLDMYENLGTENEPNIQSVKYRVIEPNLSDAYTAAGGTKDTGYNLTNTHIPATINISGKKTWLDSGNQDGVRPRSIQVQLLADGQAVSGQTKTVTADQDGNWKWKFEDLPKFRDHGIQIKYTVSETPVTWYTTTYSDDGLNIINSYTPDETGRTVRKVWLDNDDQDGIRPKSIQVQLLADGKAYGAPVELNEQNNWTYTWTRLPVNKPVAQKIQYTVQEIGSVAGYTTSYSEDTFTITNTHVVEKTSVSGGKTWNDANDQDGVRPDSITINLLADGQKIASKTVTEADDWKWSFTNLPKYRDHGTAIVYTITEDAVSGYTTSVNGYNVANTHLTESVEVSGGKTWNDANDQDGIRPESITINLLADGQKIASKTVTEADGWKWSFTNLPKYRDHGTAIVYTITEEAIEGYEADVNGYDVVNTHVPGTVDISGSKTWNDANDQDGVRPEDITINLFADGQKIASKTVTEADGWKWSFANLPEFRDHGIAIVYTITEDAVAGYETDVNGYDVVNTHVPATIEISGSKTWVDGNDVDGIRPRSITVNLLANGVRVESKTVTRADGWSWTFVNLPKYAGGVEIVYTITETPVRGYRTEVNGYDITNRHTPEPTPTITPEPEPTPTPTPTPTIPEEVKRATRKPVDGAIISTITILDDAVPLFGGRGTGDTMPYAVGGLSLAAVLLLVSAYIAKKRSGKHNG